ncbi:putative ankyrin repeat protein [Cotonvirus japonicus]|uniref:Ankyrin repeat protein n=1 Tax=Cotonvirus japonicus TaxID=2811091 RepID=A0ABM7NTZ3_9VIRU|nr:putative ankyrin repeat protein [Cotonvirus japonicus]BCS83644.1 putative ankyrin repeat protein [Cotonvirus japonicus]
MNYLPIYDENWICRLCSTITCKKNTKLMYYVTYNQYFDIDIIENYIKQNLHEINKINNYGWSALSIAVINDSIANNIQIIKLLIKYGANVNIISENSWSMLMYAIYYNNKDNNINIIKLLIENGANINYKNLAGHTPIILAAERGRIDIVMLLIQFGADYSGFNSLGNSIFVFIKQENLISCLKEIENVTIEKFKYQCVLKELLLLKN